MPYVNYVEFNVKDVPETAAFYKAVFGWEPQQFGGPDYMYAQSGDEPGIDTGMMKAENGQPSTVAVITVESVEEASKQVVARGGTMVREKFAVPTMGYAAYFTDPGGLLVGLYESDPSAN